MFRSLFGKKLYAVLIWILGIVFLPLIPWLLRLIPGFALYYTIVIVGYMVSQGFSDGLSKGRTSFQNRYPK
jgi:MFS superfamily sulfate permease-like transporter